MMAVAGQLYADSPVRICNAYLLDDQTRLGEWLIALAGVAARQAVTGGRHRVVDNADGMVGRGHGNGIG